VDTPLVDLDVSRLSSLQRLDVQRNRLRHLKLPDSLEELYCFENELETYPDIPSKLRVVNSKNNPVSFTKPTQWLFWRIKHSKQVFREFQKEIQAEHPDSYQFMYPESVRYFDTTGLDLPSEEEESDHPQAFDRPFRRAIVRRTSERTHPFLE
jgi:hypothetical protein